MKSIRTKSAIALILNLAAVLLTAAAIGWFFTPAGRESGTGNMQTGGTGCFIFFTNDSNILAALCSMLLIPFHIKSLIRGRDEAPLWALTLKFTGTSAVTLTLMVVLLFLGPIMGYRLMFEGTCLALHLICPLLAIISFCFFDGGPALSAKRALPAAAPAVIYGTVYLVNVIFTGVWIDFYHFNIGGCWYISYVALPAISYLFARLLRALRAAQAAKNALSTLR